MLPWQYPGSRTTLNPITAFPPSPRTHLWALLLGLPSSFQSRLCVDKSKIRAGVGGPESRAEPGWAPCIFNFIIDCVCVHAWGWGRVWKSDDNITGILGIDLRSPGLCSQCLNPTSSHWANSRYLNRLAKEHATQKLTLEQSFT